MSAWKDFPPDRQHAVLHIIYLVPKTKTILFRK